MDAVNALKSRMEEEGCATQHAHAVSEAPRSESEDRLAALEVSAQAAAVRLTALEASLAVDASPGTSAAAAEAAAVNASDPPKESLAPMPTAGGAAPASELTTGAASVAGTQQDSDPEPGVSALAFIPEAGAAVVPYPENTGADSVPPNPNPDSGVIAPVSPGGSTAAEVPSPAGGAADGVVYIGASPTCADSGSAKRAAQDAKGPPQMRRGGNQSGTAAGQGGTRSRGGRASRGGGRQSAHAKQGCACTIS